MQRPELEASGWDRRGCPIIMGHTLLNVVVILTRQRQGDWRHHDVTSRGLSLSEGLTRGRGCDG